MDFHNAIITKSPEETKRVGQVLSGAVIKKHSAGDSIGPICICLYGELGSGKTTFVQGLLDGLGISSRVLSPTFIIVRRYECPVLNRVISHIDCYRLKEDTRKDDVGFREYFSDPSGLVLIEWADRISTMLPEARMDISFDTKDNDHVLVVTKDSYGFTD